MGGFARSVKWLLGAAALALFAATGLAIHDASRIHDTMANGTETTAVVDGGKLGPRQVSDNMYLVDLAWQDSSGTLRTAKGLGVVSALGRQLVSGEAGDPPALLIKYQPDDVESKPVIVRQAALDQEVNRTKIAGGAIGGALCAIGFAVLAWLGRRRTSEPSHQ